MIMSAAYEYPTASYCQLPSGKWGIRVYSGSPEPGDVIKVTTKSGKEKSETVKKVLRQSNDGAAICVIEESTEASDKQRSALSSMLAFVDRLTDSADGESEEAFIRKNGPISKMDRTTIGKHLDEVSGKIEKLKTAATKLMKSRPDDEEDLDPTTPDDEE
jgi:hypothetical protein